MNVIVIGAGMMGQAVAYDLALRSKFERIVMADYNVTALEYAKRFFIEHGLEDRIVFMEANASSMREVKVAMEEMDVALSAVTYKLNLKLTEAALGTQTHFIDLGGNIHIVNKQMKMNRIARKRGLTVIPDVGLAPGMVSIIARHAIEEFKRVFSVKIRVGGVPKHPKPPLNYKIVFSPYGLINEYVEPSIILSHGRIEEHPSMTGLEEIEFPEPYGKMEAFYTSGGSSTLPYTYKDKIKHLDYKTVRYPGHCKLVKAMLDIGLASQEPIHVPPHSNVAPRDVLAKVLLENLSDDDQDVVLMQVIVDGIKVEDGKKKKKVRRTYQLVEEMDVDKGITAMMKTTAYPMAIIAQMLEDGGIELRGVMPPERSVPPVRFFDEMADRDMPITIEDVEL